MRNAREKAQAFRNMLEDVFAERFGMPLSMGMTDKFGNTIPIRTEYFFDECEKSARGLYAEQKRSTYVRPEKTIHIGSITLTGDPVAVEKVLDQLKQQGTGS